MAAKKASAVVLCLFVAAAAIWITRTQMSFLATVKGSGRSNVTRFVVCDLPRSQPATPCRIVDRSSTAFSEIKIRLANARAKLPPGKVPITSERLLKVEFETSSGKPAQECFRVIEFKDFPGSYLNQIEGNNECSAVEKYDAGYVVLEENKWP
jgi:hypothetical protein